MAGYKPSSWATLPETLDPQYFQSTPEQRRAEQERLALRAQLKLQYQLQLNNPHRKTLIDDPALTRWTYARSTNVYPNFRPTPKTSLLGFVWGVGPLVFWYYVFTTDRLLTGFTGCWTPLLQARKEKLRKEGKRVRTYNLCS